MRQIKLRGLTLSGEWVYGNYSFVKKAIRSYKHVEGGHYISNSAGMPFAYAVRPETVSEYTGLKDKNGKEIYEGDVCRILYTDWPSKTDDAVSLNDYLNSISYVGAIVYTAPSFYISLKSKYGDIGDNSLHYGTHGRIEVIGTIHQNPELL